MAHELSFKENGDAAMAWVGETPWHELGQELTAGSPIEVWLTAAGMDWEILRTPVEYKIPTDNINVPFEHDAERTVQVGRGGDQVGVGDPIMPDD